MLQNGKTVVDLNVSSPKSCNLLFEVNYLCIAQRSNHGKGPYWFRHKYCYFRKYWGSGTLTAFLALLYVCGRPTVLSDIQQQAALMIQ